MGTLRKQLRFCLFINFNVLVASSTYFTMYIDFKCNVNYNQTLDLDSEYGVLGNFSACNSMTLEEDGQNHTLGELQDCNSKCFILETKILNESGKFQRNVLFDIYEKYTNASSDYIGKVAKVMGDCVEKADKETKRLKTDSDCTYFGVYDECVFRKFAAIVFNSTMSIEFCGEDVDDSDWRWMENGMTVPDTSDENDIPMR